MFRIPTRGLVVARVLAAAGFMYVANEVKKWGMEEAAARECEVTVIADILNVRSGPADTQPIVATLRRDAVGEAERQAVNGFRLLSDGRWVKDEFVTPTSDSSGA